MRIIFLNFFARVSIVMIKEYIMEDFLKYWDGVLNKWVKTGTMPESESYWEDQNIGLLPELMPCPYLGNPEKCSAVIINYNPGAGDYDLTTEERRAKYLNDASHHCHLDEPYTLSGYMARKFKDVMLSGAYFDFDNPDLPTNFKVNRQDAGNKWWRKRKENWIDKLVPDSGKNPFALELCGWASTKWQSVKYTKELLAELRKRLAPIIDEAIANSDLGVGICVGAQWGDKVLPALGYKDVTAEVMGLDHYKRGWQPTEEKYRCFRIMRNDNGTYILNTWLSRGFDMMKVPAESTLPIQKEIIDKIKQNK